MTSTLKMTMALLQEASEDRGLEPGAMDYRSRIYAAAAPGFLEHDLGSFGGSLLSDWELEP